MISLIKYTFTFFFTSIGSCFTNIFLYKIRNNKPLLQVLLYASQMIQEVEHIVLTSEDPDLLSNHTGDPGTFEEDCCCGFVLIRL